MYVLCWSSRNTAQHSTHISLLSATCSSYIFFCICSLLFFFSYSLGLCFCFCHLKSYGITFSSIHRATETHSLSHTAIEYSCMRTHNSDKLLCDGMAEREKLDGKRIEIEREREQKKSGTEKRVQFHWHYSILCTTRMSYSLKGTPISIK